MTTWCVSGTGPHSNYQLVIITLTVCFVFILFYYCLEFPLFGTYDTMDLLFCLGNNFDINFNENQLSTEIHTWYTIYNIVVI